MSQDWTDDVYDKDAYTAHSIMTNVELMFATLKSTFSGTSAPSNTVPGMSWLDTTNHLLKIRNEANDAWLTIFDLANFGAFLDIISEKTAAAGVTIDGVLLKDNNVEVGAAGQVKTDTIVEKTGAAGVTIDGLLIKDSAIPISGIPDDGITLEKLQHGTIMLIYYMLETDTPYETVTGSGSWAAFGGGIPTYQVYVPADAQNLTMKVRLARAGSGSNHAFVRFDLGGIKSSGAESLNSDYQWVDNCIADVSSLSGWQDLSFEYYVEGSFQALIRGYNFRWE